MLPSVYIMGGLGLLVGLGLAIASKIFYVYVDPLILAIDDALPGANCGGCGLPGCSANAEAIAAGRAAPNSCVAAGDETAEAIAALMGVSIEAKEPDISKPGCTYGAEQAETKYIYNGLKDCKAASFLNGGMKVCNIGCLGLGSCKKACRFDAISISPAGLPVIDEKKCTGCGACEEACPKNIIKLSSVTRRIMREYTTSDCTTPCQRACPAGIDICEYIRHISSGDYHQALQIIKERNPFPSVIGRICPRPCETECRRNHIDESVAINFLKRFAADYERDTDKKVQPYKAPATGKKVAVIGGGVHGLSAAFFIARLGHEPTVFEATPNAGGLLRTAIARYRLPMEILNWDVQGILDIGVTLETEKALGKNFTIDSLFSNGFESVFIATGGWDSRQVRKSDSSPKQTVPGTFLLLDIINSLSDKHDKTSLDQDMVIAGGGRLALDTAKQCKKHGVKNITIIYRQTREESQLDTRDIKEAEREGIKLIFTAGISRISGQEKDITHVEYVDIKTLSKNMIPATNLIIATGRFPELIFIKQQTSRDEQSQTKNKRLNSGEIKWDGILPYKHPMWHDETGLLANGDAPTDFSSAVKAINAGRIAAASIHQIMYGISPALPDHVISRESVIQNVDRLEKVQVTPRQIMPLASNTETAEIEKGFTEDMAKAEAARCLECGLICYNKQSQGISECCESNVSTPEC
jgi:formate dehydrogenase (NADP+) beta subunit